MTGFCLTGDVFDLFVWFELMGVSAYALTAYRPEERGPIQGALNFAITNSVGAYLSLTGHRADLRPHRRPEHGADRLLARVVTRRRPRRHRVPAAHHRAAGQVGDRAVPLLARRRARGRPHAGLRAVLRRDGRARPVRDRPGLLVGVRRRARPPRPRSRTCSSPSACSPPSSARCTASASGTSSGCSRSPRSATSGMFLAGFALLTPLGLAGAALLGARPRVREGRAVPRRGHRLAPAALGQRDLAARPGQAPARHRGGVHARRPRPGRPAAVRHVPRQGLDHRQRWAAAPWLAAVFCACTVLTAGAVLRVAGGVFYGLGDPPGEDPQMAAEANEETGETESGRQRTPLTMLVPTWCPGRPGRRPRASRPCSPGGPRPWSRRPSASRTRRRTRPWS